MKYFITGIAGFLGKNLFSEIRKTDKETGIIGLARKPENLSIFTDPKTTILIGELNDSNLLAENLKGVNSIIHLAAITNAKDKDLVHKTNVLGTQNLIDACRKAKVENIIFISSRLADPFYKGNFYGQTKLEAEEIIKVSGLNFVILRPSLIYGENDKDISKLKNFIKKFPLIPVMGSGKYCLQPVHVKNIVEAIIFILKNKIFNNKTYNLAGKPVSYNEMLDQISRQMNKKTVKIHLPIKMSKFLIGIYEKISPRPVITTAQIDDLINAKIMDTTEAEHDLKFNPASFGLKN